MNGLIQLNSLLIGSELALKSLEKKSQATLLVLSDTHGSAETARRIIADFGKDCDALVFCGDGMADILSCLDKYGKSSKVCVPPVVSFVQGNGDADRYPVEFTPHGEKDGNFYHQVDVPKHSLFKAAGRNILVTHGHMESAYYGTYQLQEAARLAAADVVLYGHTHIACREEYAGTLILNPGSTTYPRRGLPPSFAVLKIPGDGELYTVTFFEILAGLTTGITYKPFYPEVQHLY